MPDQVKKKQKDMESENPLKPSLALLAKLGSIVAHVAEAMGAGGHSFDVVAIKALLLDPEIKAWIKNIGPFIPVKRT